MKRLTTAPNLALATLWADMLTHAGIAATVQRAYVSSIAGELPPDQSQPEVWVMDNDSLAKARSLLDDLRHPQHRHWPCPGCGEMVDGPFEECWNCGKAMPL
jgi:hypothetical protein